MDWCRRCLVWTEGSAVPSSSPPFLSIPFHNQDHVQFWYPVGDLKNKGILYQQWMLQQQNSSSLFFSFFFWHLMDQTLPRGWWRGFSGSYILSEYRLAFFFMISAPFLSRPTIFQIQLEYPSQKTSKIPIEKMDLKICFLKEGFGILNWLYKETVNPSFFLIQDIHLCWFTRDLVYTIALYIMMTD